MKYHLAWLADFTTFGDLLRYLRKRAQLSQKALAIATGYSESQISRLETNLRAPNQADLMPLFVPALAIQDEPETIQRLVDLAQRQRSRGTASPTCDEINRVNERGQMVPALKKVHPQNLPVQLTSFIGREKEIAALQGYIVASQARLVTLTGSGGVGKTRLAIRVAEALLDNFEDGGWWVELAPVTNPARLARAMASVLGLKESADLPAKAILINYLKNRHLLLILDNCEHLVVACAEMVDSLLRACPQLVVLATSREALRVVGEQVYRVPSLVVPDQGKPPPAEDLSQFEAIRLFTERAAATWHSFTLTSQNAPAVVEICRRLDGIPLAIELAASRMGTMTPEQVQARLDQRFRLLSTGPRTAIRRQQTLYASIDWSYHLLNPDERLLLQRLSVFSGSWTLEAAEAVCGFDGIKNDDVLDLLTSLVNKSLVHVAHQTALPSGSTVHRDATRYHMLETIRQYAAQKLVGERLPTAQPIEELKHRHLTYFVQMIKPTGYRLLGPEQITWVELLKSELENIRTALDWAFGTNLSEIIEEGLELASAPLLFWYFFGLGKEAYSWLSIGLDSLTRQANPPPVLLGKAYKTAAACLFTMGDMQKSREYLAKSINLFRQSGPSYDLAEALIWLVFVGPVQPSDTEELKKEAVEVARQAGDTGLLGVCLWIGPRSRQDLEEAANLLEKNGDQLFLADANRVHEMLAWMDGEYALAQSYLRKTLAINQRYSMKTQITFDFYELSQLAYLEGRYSQMESDAKACLEVAREISFWKMVSWALYHLGVAARRQSRLDQARQYFIDSLTLAREYHFEEMILENLSGLAGIMLAFGRLVNAIKLLGMAASCGFDTVGMIACSEFEQDLAEARLLLAEEEFQDAWEEGRAMTLDQAVQFSMEV